MKKTASIICAALLIAAAGCSENLPTTDSDFTSESTAMAKSDNATVVLGKKYLVGIGEDWCAIWGSDNEIYYDWHANAVHNIMTNTGNEVFSCTMKGVPNETGGVLYFDSEHLPPGWLDEGDPATYMASTFFGMTANWWARVTPSGKATIKAHVNPSDDDHMTFEEYCEQHPDGSAWWACL